MVHPHGAAARRQPRARRCAAARSGEWRETPVNPLRVAGERYLVAPRGHTQWVRNLRVAGGGRLRKGRQVEEFTAVEIADAEKPPILREYLRVWAWEVGRFFEGVDAASPEERLLEIAPDFPVFRITPRHTSSMTDFPDAEYLIALEPAHPRPGRRLHVSVLRRARRDGGGRVPTADRSAHRRPGQTAERMTRHRAEWARRGLLVDPARMRNLFDDARARPARGCAPRRIRSADPRRSSGRTVRSRMPRAGPCSSCPSSRATRTGTSPLLRCGSGATTGPIGWLPRLRGPVPRMDATPSRLRARIGARSS